MIGRLTLSRMTLSRMTLSRITLARMMLAVSVGLAMVGAGRVIAGPEKKPEDAAAARGFGASAANPITPIVKQMKVVETRLKGGDTGADTRGIQAQVVRDLDKLIDAASRQQSQPSHGMQKSPGGGNSPREPEDGSPQQQGAPKQGQGTQQDKGEGPTATAGGSPPSSRSGLRTPRAVATKSSRTGDRTLVREVWGHLPPAVRERVRVDFSETVLPAYDDLVRRYFEALLEEPSPRNARTPATSPVPPSVK
jgi:hypothetical protein